MASVKTMQQRIGDTLTLSNTGGQGNGVARADWARFFGQGIDNRYEAFADAAPSRKTQGPVCAGSGRPESDF